MLLKCMMGRHMAVCPVIGKMRGSRRTFKLHKTAAQWNHLNGLSHMRPYFRIIHNSTSFWINADMSPSAFSGFGSDICMMCPTVLTAHEWLKFYDRRVKQFCLCSTLGLTELCCTFALHMLISFFLIIMTKYNHDHPAWCEVHMISTQFGLW